MTNEMSLAMCGSGSEHAVSSPDLTAWLLRPRDSEDSLQSRPVFSCFSHRLVSEATLSHPSVCDLVLGQW